MNTQKQADDLPRHALVAMKETLDLCAEVFPNIKRNDLQKTFVSAYFNQPIIEEPCEHNYIKQTDGDYVCEICLNTIGPDGDGDND